MLRRSPRVLALWAGALALAVVTGVVIAGDLATIRRRAATLGPLRSVVVATRDLHVGSTVTATDVSTRRVHASQLPYGAVTDRSAVLGRVVQVTVLRDAYIGYRNLAARRRAGLDGALPEGTRAMRVVTEDGLRPEVGSAVDVYAAVDQDRLGTGSAEPGGAVVVAAGVLVLAIDAPEASGGVSGDLGVTLLVDDAQAADLAFASGRGTLVLALVPPEEARVPRNIRRR